MTNNDILIKGLPFFEELFLKFGVNEDCQQMIFVDFLLYDNAKLNKMNDNGQIRYGIVRFIKNYGFSKTSRYYAQYEKYYEIHSELPED